MKYYNIIVNNDNKVIRKFTTYGYQILENPLPNSTMYNVTKEEYDSYPNQITDSETGEYIINYNS